jgi:hypothetical protein
LQTNSEDFSALRRQQKLLVQVVQQGQVAGVDIHTIEDLPHSRHALPDRPLQLELLALDDVLPREVRRVYGRNEDLVVGVLLVLQLELVVLQLALQKVIFPLLPPQPLPQHEDLLDVLEPARPALHAAPDLVYVAPVELLLDQSVLLDFYVDGQVLVIECSYFSVIRN